MAEPRVVLSARTEDANLQSRELPNQPTTGVVPATMERYAVLTPRPTTHFSQFSAPVYPIPNPTDR